MNFKQLFKKEESEKPFMITEKEMPDKQPAQEKKEKLFLKQKETLDLFLERGAISQNQYDKSLNTIKEKMGF